MVAPHDFEFNEETSVDNEFQTRPREHNSIIRERALSEFHTMVEVLRKHGITVVIPEPRSDGPKTPDAVFPNNWFVTDAEGNMLLCPMAPPGRRREKRIDAVEKALLQNGFIICNVINIGRFYETEHFLEGTGCMVFDHPRRHIYAALSNRCHIEQMANFAQLRQYTYTTFNTRSRTGAPIYHTNVMLSIGERFAVVCSQSLPDADEQRRLLAALQTHHEVIDISLAQVEESLCGNILQLCNAAGERFVVMSQRAHDGFTESQRRQLRQHGTLIPIDLQTIEHVGGGSARCMLAEIFLPQNPSHRH